MLNTIIGFIIGLIVCKGFIALNGQQYGCEGEIISNQTIAQCIRIIYSDGYEDGSSGKESKLKEFYEHNGMD